MSKRFGFSLLAAFVLALLFAPLALAADGAAQAFDLVQLVLNNPIVQDLAGAAAASLATAAIAAVVAWLVHNQRAREVAQVAVDLAALVDPLVRQVEATGLPGPMKFSRVYRGALLELKNAGIEGRAARVAEKYLPDIINAAAARLFPKAS